MNERLQQFLAAENISQSQFAETIGVARASISHIIAGRNKPGYEFICSIFDNFPSLNPEWLLLGKGKMYKTAEKTDLKPVTAQTMETANVPSPEPAPTQVQTQAQVQDPAQQTESDGDRGEDLGLFSAVTNAHETAPAPAIAEPVADANVSKPAQASSGRTVTKIIVFYSDNSFQELKP